ncbi:hypothetical protein [Archaeoglobus profundus]|uniref:Phage protein Gp138 N-terminal domain-containing protein n=1 Tax=Archaeoglobus profundus (strain DSM 5631 / JCM 9629 / NBRC 100127 / Av18) TaxID=572546 RepID=D2REI5_ARCPA|nr:hypothetical protein [Archaeoglobus profundus]ADB58529.1 hypothetical protein Arcpr_1482 [Archaeoglobus profundus DSM 5631]
MIEQIKKLIDVKLDNINTVALGIITQVDLKKLRCNVKLKHKIQGNEIELFDVPIACLKSSAGTIVISPAEGDIVLVLFSKYELVEQLKNKEAVDVNELLKFNLNNAIVFGGLFTLVDSIPTIGKDELLIEHKSGNYIKFQQDGKITIKGDVYVDGNLDFKQIRGVDAESGEWHKHS